MYLDAVSSCLLQTVATRNNQENSQSQVKIPEARPFREEFLPSMLKSLRIGQHFQTENKGQDKEQEKVLPNHNTTTFQEILERQFAYNNKATLPAPPKNNTKIEESMAVSPQLLSTGIVDDFVRAVLPIAKIAGTLIGLDPKLLIAQAALETGWGKFIIKTKDGISSNNLFNIKASFTKPYQSVESKTTEYQAHNPMPMKITQSFKTYSSIQDSFKDYIALLKNNKRYQLALAKTYDPQLYIEELHKAGYATDPNYSKKVMLIYQGEELRKAMPVS